MRAEKHAERNEELRILKSAGFTRTELARMYGCDCSAVRSATRDSRSAHEALARRTSEVLSVMPELTRADAERMARRSLGLGEPWRRVVRGR